MAGWIPAYRKCFDPDHWLAPTSRDPASRRDAWFDLLQMAAHKPTETRYCTLNRGEFMVSVRYLADRWCWSKSAVNRFLNELRTRSAIEISAGTASGTGTGTPSGTPSGTASGTPAGMVYRVVNYDTYAANGNGERDTERDTSRDTERDKTGTASGTNTRSKEVNKNFSTSSRGAYPPEFEAVWTIHRRGPKAKALAEWRKAVPSRIAQDELVRCLKAYVGKEINDRFRGHDLFRWIRDERWEEYREASRPASRYETIRLEDWT